MIPAKCESLVTDSKVVCKDPGAARKITFNNASLKLVNKIRVDGCVPHEGLRCDFLVAEGVSRHNFVELKGRNVEDGVAQLKSSIAQLKGMRNSRTCVRAFLICNESPSVTQMQRFKPRFERDTGAALFIRTRQHEVSI